MDGFIRRNLKPSSDSYLSQSKNKTLPVLNSIRTRIDDQDSYVALPESQPIGKSATNGSHHNGQSTFLSSYSGAIQGFGSRDSIEDKDTNAERVKLKIMSIWNNVKYGINCFIQLLHFFLSVLLFSVR